MAKLAEIAYFVDDIPGMTDFYRRLLGSEPVAQSEKMAIFLLGETRLFLHYIYQPTKDELSPENHIAFSVANLDETCSQLEAVGLVLEIPPASYYWGRSAYLRDPGGQLIELAEAQKDLS